MCQGQRCSLSPPPSFPRQHVSVRITGPDRRTRHCSELLDTLILCPPNCRLCWRNSTFFFGNHQCHGRAKRVDCDALCVGLCQLHIRVLHPAATEFAPTMLGCGNVSVPSCSWTWCNLTNSSATKLLSLGCLGLRSAQRTRISAFWASWADSLDGIQNVMQLVHQLKENQDTPCLQAVMEFAVLCHHWGT